MRLFGRRDREPTREELLEAAQAIIQETEEAADELFLEALMIVIERAREEFACPACSSRSVEAHGVDDCSIEHHVLVNMRCGQCHLAWRHAAHHLLAVAAHAQATYDVVDMHLTAKEHGVLPEQDSGRDSGHDSD